MFDILKPINQCPHTSLEHLVSSDSFFNVDHFVDETGRNRFVFFINSEIVAAILFDDTNTCMFKETKKEHRRKNYQNSLWFYARSKLGNIKHSDCLTAEGKRFLHKDVNEKGINND